MSDPIERLNTALEGRYTIERELGEGGMATVYLADDLKHERKVALKVLKPELAAVVGAERFLAEIKTTANLTHPNILPLHDSGEADSFLYYVMPYIEGESLRDRLDREHQLPVDEAVKITTDLAEALDYAHRNKVIHRDIKPANIMLHEGRPLIADFGIALAVGAAGGGRLTETGLSLGTPFYMSPEQATGDQFVGASTDTYALGSVLYEMLTGDPPYMGSTAQAVLGQIISSKAISATEKRTSIPANVDAALRKALEKLPADRFKSSQEFAKALEDEHFRYGESVGVVGGVAVGPWKRVAMAATVLALGFALTLGWVLLRPEPPQPVERFVLAVGEGQAPSEQLDVAPDGSSIVLVYPNENGEPQIWLRRWDDLTPTPIPGTEGDIHDPVISPDGEEVVYVSVGELKVAPLKGGLVRTLADDAVCCSRWSPDGFIYYSPVGRTINRVRADGTGVPEPVTQREEGDGSHGYFEVLPGGEVGVFNAGFTVARLDAIRMATGERKVLAPGLRAYATPTGHLVFATLDGQILAAPFDHETMELERVPIPLVDGIGITPTSDAMYSLSENGTLVYWTGQGPADLVQMAVVNLAGSTDVLPLTPRAFGGQRWSPDGNSIAYFSGEAGDRQIYTYDVEAGTTPRQLTFEGDNSFPVWSPDGNRIAFRSRREGTDGWDLFVRSVNDDSREERIRTLPGNQFIRSWPEDDLVVFENTPNPSDFRALKNPTASASDADLDDVVVSPAGGWAAYQSDETGTGEVYVRSFPSRGRSRPTRIPMDFRALRW